MIRKNNEMMFNKLKVTKSVTIDEVVMSIIAKSFEPISGKDVLSTNIEAMFLLVNELFNEFEEKLLNMFTKDQLIGLGSLIINKEFRSIGSYARDNKECDIRKDIVDVFITGFKSKLITSSGYVVKDLKITYDILYRLNEFSVGELYLLIMYLENNCLFDIAEDLIE